MPNVLILTVTLLLNIQTYGPKFWTYVLKLDFQTYADMCYQLYSPSLPRSLSKSPVTRAGLYEFVEVLEMSDFDKILIKLVIQFVNAMVARIVNS
jgi:hypothetical protein